MKFGAKLLDPMNINHFTHVISTMAKLCAKTSNDKSCVLKLNVDSLYFILPEFASNNVGSGGNGRTSFWARLDAKSIFEFYTAEGKSDEENLILLEIQPDSLLRALKSTTNIKMIRIKLTKRQTPCITIEIDLHSMTSKQNSRTITHDIPVKVISTSKVAIEEFQEPNVCRTTLSIQLPPLKIIKHMIERMKVLSDFIYLEATDRGTLQLKIETDAVSVCTYFRNLVNLPIVGGGQHTITSQNRHEFSECVVRLSLKRLHDFINSIQFQPTKIICNFLNQRYAHFFVIHDEDLVLQYLISSVMN